MDKKRALEVLDQIPTIGEQVDALEMAIEALENRTEAKWIEREKYTDTWYCSNCGDNALYYMGQPFGRYTVFQVRSEFCPNCGAQMRGEK